MTQKENIVDIASKGIEISREIARLEKELEAIKGTLRGHAEAERGDRKSVEIETPAGVVQVAFRPDRLYVKAGDTGKVEALSADLQPKVFNAIFTAKVTYDLQKEWELVASSLEEAEERAVRGVVSATSYAPSVTFPK